MWSRIIILFISVTICNFSTVAQSRDVVETATDVSMFMPAATGACVALFERDYDGLIRLVKSGATAVATAYLLKYTVKKHRPDGSDTHSFPSNHAGVAFAGATYLLRRYGWKWGAPAYVVAVGVGGGRIYSKRHDVWDVLTGAAIGVGSAWLFTKPFVREHNTVLFPFFSGDGDYGVCFSMSF